jgi:hypothetical protein
MVGPDVAAHLDAVRFVLAFPESDIEHRHIRLSLGDQLEGLGSVRSLAHHGHVLLAPEQVPNTTANQLVIVEEENPDCHSTMVPNLA